MPVFLVDVRPILEEIGGSIHVLDELDLTELVVGDERFEMTAPPTIDVTISNAGEALVSVGRVTAPVRATCVRCLCSFETQISGDVEGYWLRPGDRAPESEEVSGSVDAEGSIDLGPALVAALVVEAPFAPVHDENCKGLCPTCGIDLNTESCECDVPADSQGPFAVLRTLLDETEESGGETE